MVSWQETKCGLNIRLCQQSKYTKLVYVNHCLIKWSGPRWKGQKLNDNYSLLGIKSKGETLETAKGERGPKTLHLYTSFNIFFPQQRQKNNVPRENY